MKREWIAACTVVDKRDRLNKVYGWMRDGGPPPVVTDDGRAYGIVDVRAFLAGGLRRATTLDHLTTPVPTLPKDAPLQEVVDAFAHTQAPYLPVVDQRRQAVGVVVPEEIVRLALRTGPSAAEATRQVPILDQGDDVEAALHAFRATPVDLLPYMDGKRLRVLRRQALVMRVADAHDGPNVMARYGEKEPVRDDPLDALVENPARTLSLHAPFEQVQAALLHGPCPVAARGKAVGLVTGPSVLARLVSRKQEQEPQGPVIRYS